MEKTIYKIEVATQGLQPVEIAEFIRTHYPRQTIVDLKGYAKTNSKLFSDSLLVAVSDLL